MSLMYRIKPAAPAKRTTPKKEAVAADTKKVPAVTSGKKRGPKPSGDPSVVLTLRAPKSLADRLKSDWRKRAVEWMAENAV